MDEVGKKIPIIEIFGPTLQGEGAIIGNQTMFLRTGGCDFRCTYCDTMYAVDPKQIKERALRMTQKQILGAVLSKTPDNILWISISGGNPAMWDLYEVVRGLQREGKKVSVETQGSIWQPWLRNCDVLTVSPKGPGMGSETDLEQLDRFMNHIDNGMRDMVNIKIPVFGEPDLEFASTVADRYPGYPLYLTVGNPFITGSDKLMQSVDIGTDLLQSLDHIFCAVQNFPNLGRASILPQLHVLLWGNEEAR